MRKVKRLGAKRALKLLSQFGTIDHIKKTSVDELKTIGGVGDTLANRILAKL